MNRFVMLILAAALCACGGNYSQASARDNAASRMCNCYARAQQIGTGSNKKYETRDSCEVDQRAFWNDQWSISQCDGKIRPSDFDTCTRAIDNTDCNDGFDVLNTVFNKCGSGNVCKG